MANTFKIDTKSSVSNSGTSNSNTNVVTSDVAPTHTILQPDSTNLPAEEMLVDETTGEIFDEEI